MRIRIVVTVLLLAAGTACSGDAEETAAIPELDAQSASEVPVEPVLPEFTVDTQVVRIPAADEPD